MSRCWWWTQSTCRCRYALGHDLCSAHCCRLLR
jgi:hypothetical protein